MPCRADCECYMATEYAGGDSCGGTRCMYSGGQSVAWCGDVAPKEWPVWCACTVGTCDERGCCVQADGTVATATEPPCLPPDGGQ